MLWEAYSWSGQNSWNNQLPHCEKKSLFSSGSFHEILIKKKTSISCNVSCNSDCLSSLSLLFQWFNISQNQADLKNMVAKFR